MNKLPLPVQSALWWLLPLVALAVTFGLETDWGRSVEARPQAVEPIEPKPVVTALLPEYEIQGGVAARSETVERTLFNPTRRPAPTLAQEGGAGPGRMKRGQFALTGTMLIEGKNTAFLREVAGNKSRHVHAGESINGMRVAEVKADRVVLALGDESEELVLKVATNPRPTPQPVIAAAPQPAQGVTAAPPGQVPPAARAAAAAVAPNAGAPQTALERRRAARAAAAAAAANQGTAPPANPNANPWDSIGNAYQQRAGRQNQQQK